MYFGEDIICKSNYSNTIIESINIFQKELHNFNLFETNYLNESSDDKLSKIKDFIIKIFEKNFRLY